MGSLSGLFAPHRGAVVGATDRAGSIGRALTENLRADFDGDGVPVNPNYDSVLGRAEENGVPVLLVRADTLSVVDRAEDVIRSGRTRDEKTVRTMRRLLTEHADVDTVLGEERNGHDDEP